MPDTFDVYVHQDRVQMPAGIGWVVTVVRQRDARMQQFAAWDHQFPASIAGDAVVKAIEFAGARALLHQIGDHPNYDQAPDVEMPGPAEDVVEECQRLLLLNRREDAEELVKRGWKV